MTKSHLSLEISINYTFHKIFFSAISTIVSLKNISSKIPRNCHRMIKQAKVSEDKINDNFRNEDV